MAVAVGPHFSIDVASFTKDSTSDTCMMVFLLQQKDKKVSSCYESRQKPETYAAL